MGVRPPGPEPGIAIEMPTGGGPANPIGAPIGGGCITIPCKGRERHTQRGKMSCSYDWTFLHAQPGLHYNLLALKLEKRACSIIGDVRNMQDVRPIWDPGEGERKLLFIDYFNM